MNKHTRLASALVVASFSAAGVALAAADAGPPASASAAPKASARARPAPRSPLEKEDIPREVSERPTVLEWKDAVALEVTRRSPEATSCRASRVREWLKVHCDFPTPGIRQLSGSADGVLLWVVPKANENVWEGGQGGELILPMRVGDRRVLQFFVLEGGGYEGIWSTPSVVVDEVWIEGDPRPTVVLR